MLSFISLLKLAGKRTLRLLAENREAHIDENIIFNMICDLFAPVLLDQTLESMPCPTALHPMRGFLVVLVAVQGQGGQLCHVPR